MSKSLSQIDKIGWCFDNTYARLSDAMLTKIKPIPVKFCKNINEWNW